MGARMSRTLAKSECPLTNILCTPRPVQQAREHSTCFLLLVPPSLPRPSQDFQPAFQLRASFQILLASFPLLGAPSKPQPGIHSERTSANLPKPLARKRAQLSHRPRNRETQKQSSKRPAHPFQNGSASGNETVPDLLRHTFWLHRLCPGPSKSKFFIKEVVHKDDDIYRRHVFPTWGSQPERAAMKT